MSNRSSPEEAQRAAPPALLYMVPSEGQDRSIDVVDLIATMWARKWLVAMVTGLFALAGVAWALITPPIYRAEVVLAPARLTSGPNISGRLGGLASLAGLDLNSGGDSTQAIATLNSRAFAESFIADKNLLPTLFADEWDPGLKRWKADDVTEQPTLWHGVKYFTTYVLSVEHDEVNGLVTLAIEWNDPEVAAGWAQELVNRINEQLRLRDLEHSERKLKYLNAELETANLLEVRQAISSVIEEQIQTITLAKGDPEYAFRVIDPPRVPQERERPKRTLIVVLATMTGGLVGVCAVAVAYMMRRRPPAP